MNNKLESKIIGITGLVVAVSFIIAFTINAITDINSLKEESTTKSRLIGDTIARSIRTIMLTGNGNIASQWTDDLRMINRLKGLYVIESDGMLAFRSTRTLDTVNQQIGKTLFHREKRTPIRIMDENDPRLRWVYKNKKGMEYIDQGPEGSLFTQLRPIFSGVKCAKCHTKKPEILGVLKIATSIEEVDVGIKKTITMTIAGAIISSTFVIGLMWILLRIVVTKPIAQVAYTIKDIIISERPDKAVEYESADEIGGMVENFNIMTARLNEMYTTLEEKVAERTKQLVQAERIASAGQLATGLIHEIRNPLSGVKLSIQLLENEVDQSLKDDILQISREVQRMESLLNDLLRFARPHPPIFSAIDINEVVSRTVSLTRRRAQSSSVEILEKLREPLPRIMADPSLMQQVFLNLSLNAINAMPDGGRLTIESLYENGFVEIRFTDTGHGISEDYIGKIFDPFFTTRGSSGGSGLGLSISFRIIDEHKGQIEVDSKGGSGTTFTVRLKAV
ncbi:MAG: ATP-binding protein [Deltaproteobacteria bacterium]|nr:ATP-binding protein [Deltaproteobacteria bacterium]